MTTVPHIDTTPDAKLEAWMSRNRARRIITVVSRQLENARRRGFRKTQIPLADLETLLDMVHNGITPTTKEAP